MSGIPVIAGGAAVDCKPSIIVGGAEVPIYDGYVIQGGQAVKIYQSADCQAQNWSPFVLSSDGSFSGSWTIVTTDKMSLFKLIFDSPITFASSQTICTISSFTNTNSNVAAMYIEDDSGNYFASGLLKNKPCIIASTVATASKEFTFAVSQLNTGGNETLSWAAGALTFNGIQLNNIDILS